MQISDSLHPTAVKVMQAIAKYEKENAGWHPTVRDIMEKLGGKSTSAIVYWIEKLEKQGYMESRPGKPAIRLTQSGKSFLMERR